MKVDDNEIRKTLFKEFIKKNWKNFFIGVLVISFLSVVIIFTSQKGNQNIFVYGKESNLIVKKAEDNREIYFLEIELDNQIFVNVKISDPNIFQKDKSVKLKKITNDMLKIEAYQLAE